MIFESGFSRIPVYAKDRNDVIGLLFTKDLIFIDPDDETPLENFVQIFGRPVSVSYACRGELRSRRSTPARDSSGFGLRKLSCAENRGSPKALALLLTCSSLQSVSPIESTSLL